MTSISCCIFAIEYVYFTYVFKNDSLLYHALVLQLFFLICIVVKILFNVCYLVSVFLRSIFLFFMSDYFEMIPS